MSIDLDRFALTVSLAMPTAHSLSQRSRVGGCGYPKAESTVRIHSPFCALINAAAYSASAADATTTSMMLLIALTAPLICVGLFALPK